ncbi:MAG: tetratricopeptide repeat protein [Phycisphaerales bacterium]
MPLLVRLTLGLTAGMLLAPSALAQKATPAAPEPFTLDLPEWNPDPDELPPELRPLDVVRPTLPEDVAAKVGEFEERIAEIDVSWLDAETREAQDALLEEVIALTERALALRVEHQGNTDEIVRWRDAAGDPSEWHEVGNTRRYLVDLRLYHSLTDVDRSAMDSLVGTVAEVIRLYGEGQYADAQAVTERQLEIRRRVLGDEHRDTQSSLSNMGALLYAQGRLADAEPYFREVVEARQRALGDEHPDTLYSIDNMGALLQSLGRLAEAEPYQREAMEGRRRVLGDAHPDTLTSVNNMAFLLESQGRLAEAEPYQRTALEGMRRALGDAHPNTLTTINNMGYLLKARGRLAEAERYYRGALAGRRRALGNAHPDTLSSMNNVGTLLKDQGRLAEAEPYYREALEGSRLVLGDQHPSTLDSINNMGSLFEALGQTVEAELYHREALEGRRRALGETHPSTLASMHNIGTVLALEGRLADAEPYLREALDGCRRALGDTHPDTLISINNMGVLLQSQGKLAEAGSYFREAIAGYRRVLGDAHPDTLTSINNMGSLLKDQGRLAEAEPYYREALATAERQRVKVAGGAATRAQFGEQLNLTGIAAGYARTLVGLDQSAEALSVLERGRGRAGLDLLAGGRDAAALALRARFEEARLARYDAALKTEEQARLDLAEAESRLAVAPDDQKAEWTRRVRNARRDLRERTAAVFQELRGLTPTLDPMTSEQIVAALRPGEALVTWSWTAGGAIALVARDGRVRGLTLASTKDETETAVTSLRALREALAARPRSRSALAEETLDAARSAAAPAELLSLLDGAESVLVVPGGTLTALSIDLLLGRPVAYAPSATMALRPRTLASESAPLASSGGVIVGDPVFGRGGSDSEDSTVPDTGVLLTMVTEGSNAALAGLRRGDVLLTYGERSLESPTDLGPAIQEAAETLVTRGVADERPVAARVWRDGEEIEVALATGRMGVQMSQAPVADGLRSMRLFDLSADGVAADAAALEQVRFYGAELSPLPATRLEATAIAAMLGEDATLLLGEKATAPAVRKAVESSTPQVIHHATHGLLGNDRDPLLASLALTKPAEPTIDDIGFLTLGEILEHWGGQLRGVELVTLSACDTGRGIRQGGTDMGLPLGLLVGGADTVLASLWKVDDLATALLMARFYANWLGETKSAREIDGAKYDRGESLPKLAALREAQAWLRALTTAERDRLIGADPEAIAAAASRGPSARRGRIVTANAHERPFEHPYYWAAFVLYGSAE